MNLPSDKDFQTFIKATAIVVGIIIICSTITTISKQGPLAVDVKVTFSIDDKLLTKKAK